MTAAPIVVTGLRALSPVFIANRGEIACRIVRSCRRLGLESIVGYSDADAHSRAVAEADRTARIGPADAAHSYLDVDAVVQAALAAGARSLHPGYGFLSERAVLARRCIEAGLVWIGPRPALIEAMGSKIEAKAIAAAAGVAVLPGDAGESQDPAVLAVRAHAIGFPLLIKASGGGGGRGMRRVDSPAQFVEQLALARREAFRAFGDDRVLLEKLVARARHIEVQIAGDLHGGLIHLYERECSIQRHYQKLIEEAPAPWLSPTQAAQLQDSALRLGRHMDYDSLGTVEFVLDQDSGETYFLEMNTRLQVEHPVTEAITGVDLVALQMRVAAGERLPVQQSQLQVRGHAMEARVACEDVEHDFRPQTGRVQVYREPSGEGLRVDSGLCAGSEVSAHYDSLVAKVIAAAPSRDEARLRLEQSLAAFELRGLATNQRFLRDVLLHPDFAAAPVTTDFLGQAFPGGWRPDARLHWQMGAAAAFAVRGDSSAGAGDPWRLRDGFRLLGSTGVAAAAFEVTLGEEAPVSVSLAPRGEAWQVTVGDEARTVQVFDWDTQGITLQSAGDAPRRFHWLKSTADVLWLSHNGLQRQTRVQSRLHAMAAQGTASAAQGCEIRAAMPGIITAVQAATGEDVRAGDPLITMEAMKLVFALTAPVDGRVRVVDCALGDTVVPGQRLVDIDPSAAVVATEAEQAPQEEKPGHDR